MFVVARMKVVDVWEDLCVLLVGERDVGWKPSILIGFWRYYLSSIIDLEAIIHVKVIGPTDQRLLRHEREQWRMHQVQQFLARVWIPVLLILGNIFQMCDSLFKSLLYCVRDDLVRLQYTGVSVKDGDDGEFFVYLRLFLQFVDTLSSLTRST